MVYLGLFIIIIIISVFEGATSDFPIDSWITLIDSSQIIEVTKSDPYVSNCKRKWEIKDLTQLPLYRAKKSENKDKSTQT